MRNQKMSGDDRHLIRSNPVDLESADQQQQQSPATPISTKFQDLIKHLDRGFSGRRLTFKDPSYSPLHSYSPSSSLDHHYVDGRDDLADSAPPEWALLLIGCLLGLASGLCVAFFNKGVSFGFIF